MASLEPAQPVDKIVDKLSAASPRARPPRILAEKLKSNNFNWLAKTTKTKLAAAQQNLATKLLNLSVDKLFL